MSSNPPVWSLWLWVIKIASKCRTSSRNICCRKSGPQSSEIVRLEVLIRIEVRKRLSRGSVDLQTWHWQPISGTPPDVPVPRNVTSINPKIAERCDKKNEFLKHQQLFARRHGEKIQRNAKRMLVHPYFSNKVSTFSVLIFW